MNYSGKNVLVTGGAGFIGSEVVKQLSKLSVNVRVLDDLSFGLSSNIDGNIEFIHGDIRNKEIVKKSLKDIDVVFHLAALPFIPHSYLSPEDVFTVNANGTLTLIKEAMGLGLKRFVFISSSEVYGTAQYIPMDENHPLLPHSTYAVSKLAAERLAYTMHKEHHFPLVILRPFNTYGPRDSHPRIIPEIISQLLKQNKLHLGNIEATRDMTHVSDIARGIVLCGAKQAAIGEVINIGSGLETSIKHLISKIAEILGKDDYQLEIAKSRFRPFDVQRLYASIKKARMMGWKPKVSLEVGLKRTIDWYVSTGKLWRWELEDYQKKKMGIPSEYINSFGVK